MTANEILELERKHYRQQLEYRLKQARHENKQFCINTCINIIVSQINANTIALMCGIARDS